MPIQVWDFRKDIQNLVATPEIRARFNEIKPGAPPRYHSHDLGGEIFLVLEGEVTFDVEGEVVTGMPGQAIFVPPHQKHRLYNQGTVPARYYLSVTPHVEPTHTHYDQDLNRLPPSYGGWRAAGNPTPPSGLSTPELADRLVVEARRLAEAAQQAEAAIRAQAEALKAASAREDRSAAKAAADAIWSAAYPTLRQAHDFERIWNDLAPQTM